MPPARIPVKSEGVLNNLILEQKWDGELDTLVRVLIVDDDDLCRGLIRDAVEIDEIELHLASDGLEALSIIEKHVIDVLITDLNMPGMDGLELINHARQVHPNMLSILITGFGSLESAIQAIQQGAYDYVQKPFSIERIAVVARNAIEKARILREKSKLLRELETAYQNLKLLEMQSGGVEDVESKRSGLSPSKDAFYVFSQQALPLFYYDSPVPSSSHLLSQLERLNELKRSGGISDDEFSALKQRIIKQSRPA
jgi:CheY-like chemotaxis protein